MFCKIETLHDQNIQSCNNHLTPAPTETETVHIDVTVVALTTYWSYLGSTICLHSYIHLFTIDSSVHKLQSQRLVTMSASLRTQTGLPNLTIQVLSTRVCFINIWCTSLNSVHYNLEHGLAIINESVSPLNLNYTASVVKVQIRSDITSHAIPDTVYLPCTLNWAKLVWTGHNQSKQVLM